MNVRVNTVRGATSPDLSTAYVHEHLLPRLHEQDGYRGGMTSLDPGRGVVGVITLWKDKNALEASDLADAGWRSEAVSRIGGAATAETYEQVIREIGDPPPAKGCLVLFVSFETHPARVDENVAFFRVEVLPVIKQTPGFRALRNLINRTTGHGLIAIIVSDQDALEAAEAGFEARRAQDETHGMRFGDITQREVVYLDKL